jgi:anti-sigma B factor antagonist
MSNVRYLNSSGLNSLISLLTKARKSGGEVMIANVSPKVKDLLIITRLNTVFTVTDSVQEAQEKLQNL